MRKPSTGEIAGPGLRRADDVRMEYANESLTGSADLTPQSPQLAVIKLKVPRLVASVSKKVEVTR